MDDISDKVGAEGGIIKGVEPIGGDSADVLDLELKPGNRTPENPRLPYHPFANGGKHDPRIKDEAQRLWRRQVPKGNVQKATALSQNNRRGGTAITLS